jgi:hypothetical protein
MQRIYVGSGIDMKKAFLSLLVVLVLLLTLSGCSSESEALSITEPGNITGVNLIHIDGCLYYDTKTNIVYIWNGFFYCNTTATTPSPYYASNGLPYKYDPDTKQLKEITNGD